jgi:hypothetical protein
MKIESKWKVGSNMYKCISNTTVSFWASIIMLLTATMPFANAMDDNEKKAAAYIELLRERQQQDIDEKKDEINRNAIIAAQEREFDEDQLRRKSGDISIGFVFGFGLVFPVVLGYLCGIAIGYMAIFFKNIFDFQLNEERWGLFGFVIGGGFVPLLALSSVIENRYPEDIALLATSLLIASVFSWKFRKEIGEIIVSGQTEKQDSRS